MIKKSVSKLRQSEAMLYDFLLPKKKPVKVTKIIDALYEDAPYDIRVAIWSLVEKGEIEWTDGRRLRIKQVSNDKFYAIRSEASFDFCQGPYDTVEDAHSSLGGEDGWILSAQAGQIWTMYADAVDEGRKWEDAAKPLHNFLGRYL